MRSKYFTLFIMTLFLAGTKVFAQCPTLEKFNQGQGGAGSCGGVNGNPIPANFIGTPYATVPSGTKTAELNASWPTFPNPVPAVGGIYFNAMPTDHKSGPPTVPTLSGGKYKAQYCFYHPTGANIPIFKTITIVYIDPQPDTVLRVCSYDPGGNEIPPPVILRQPTDQVGCLGYKSTFSVAAIPGQVSDTALDYQWMKDGVDIPGATDSFLTIVVTAADTGTDRYQCRVIADPSLAIQLTVEVSLFLNKPHIWTGAVSTAWNNAGNWIPATIPDSTNHVYVRNTTNKPLLSGLSDTGRCKCLTLDTGWVNLMLLGRLEVAGRIQPFAGGYINGVDGHLVMNGTELPQDLPDSAFLNNTLRSLTFANVLGVNNIDTLDLTGVLTRISGILTTAGKITLKSTSTRTARVAQGDAAGGFISGEVTVERYVPVVPGGYRSWRLLAPITTSAQTIQAAWQEGATSIAQNPKPGYGTMITCNSNFNTSAGFDQIMPNMSILKWDVATQSLTTVPVTNTNVKALSSEVAYFLYIRGDRSVLPAPIYNMANSTTLRSKGTIKTGDQPGVVVPAGQLVAVGNPFASHIDFAAIAPADRSNVNNKFWLWDPRLSGAYQVGAYVLFDATTGFTPSVTGGSYNVANTVIPMGMAFFVEGGAGLGSLVVRESYKAGNDDNNGFKSTVDNERLHIQLSYVKNGTTVFPADGLYAVFGKNYSAALDGDDAKKLTNMGENLAVLRDEKSLALEARPSIKANDTLPLKMWHLNPASVYRLTITPEFKTLGLEARVIDKYLETEQPISLTKPTNIDFKINADSASYAQDRFYIAFSVDPTTTVKNVETLEDVTIYPNPTDAQNINIQIKNAPAGKYGFKIIDVQGRVVHNETYDHSGQALMTSLAVRGRLVPANYVIAISKDGQELATQKLIINK